MASFNIYSKKNLKVIKILSLAILILISFTTPFKFYNLMHNEAAALFSPSEIVITIVNFLLNLFLIIFSAILIKHPEKFFLIGIESLAWSICMSIFDSESMMSLIMLCVTFSTLLLRSNFLHIKKKAFLAFILLYLFELLIPLREGLSIFIEVFFEKIGTSILLGILLFFAYEYSKQKGINESVKDKVLNLAQFKGIDRSDLYLLQDILANKKYKEIAHKIHGSEGALRNKLSKIYKILEVGDRIGFLTIYSGYKLIYEPGSIYQSTTQPSHQADRSC